MHHFARAQLRIALKLDEKRGAVRFAAMEVALLAKPLDERHSARERRAGAPQSVSFRLARSEYRDVLRPHTNRHRLPSLPPPAPPFTPHLFPATPYLPN